MLGGKEQKPLTAIVSNSHPDSGAYGLIGLTGAHACGVVCVRGAPA